MHQVHLKPGREKSVLARHPWIFSGAIATETGLKNSDIVNGAVVSVISASGKHLGTGLWSQKSEIRCRMLSFDDLPAETSLTTRIHGAIDLRKALFADSPTNSFRLINAEGDFLPGLIVDKYADALVVQISIAGMNKLKAVIIDILVKALHPSWIYEKSTAPSRREEGLQSPYEATLYGTPQQQILINEDGLQFFVSPIEGQKTGFFLDQREMRKLVGHYSKGKKVLNCFSYTGGFTLHALRGGALLVDSVDISKEATQAIQENITLNHLSHIPHHEYAEDVFEFLKRPTNANAYDMVILDPPAFAKRKADVPQAARGYKEINRLAFKMLPKNSYLLTCSCSYHVDEVLFRQILFAAALDAGRDVRIIERHHLAPDHPLSIYHPEGSYLKSFFCYVS